MNKIDSLLLLLVVVVGLWELFWKAIALYKAGRNGQIVWYLIIFIIASVGIIPIAYLLFFQAERD